MDHKSLLHAVHTEQSSKIRHQSSRKSNESTAVQAAPEQIASDHNISEQILWMQQHEGNASVQRKIAAIRAAKKTTAPRVQRYQAGVTGHETERNVLHEIGFSEDEAEKAYIGNWLRDFSQLIAFDNSFKAKAKQMLVPIIGLGEFGESFSMDDLGVYVPSEHMDNPLGGQTIEDPLNTSKDFSHLSARQTASQAQLDLQAPSYKAAAKAAGLPEYIGRSKAQASNTLKAAYRKGRTPDGLRLMGEALHDVEDYFAHTNFTEIAIWTLAQQGNTKALSALKKTDGMEMAGGTAENGTPKLIAGTYKPGGNDSVSLLETVKTQLNTKQFIYATLKGLIRTGAIGVSTVTQALAKYGIGVPAGVIGGAVGAVGGGAEGVVEGAAQGMDEGARNGQSAGYAMGYSVLGQYGGNELGQELGGIGHYVGAAEGLVEGAVTGGWKGLKSGAKKGWNAAFGTAGGYAAKGADAATKFAGEVVIVGGKIVITTQLAMLLMENPVISAVVYGVIKGIHALIDEMLDKQIHAATAQAVTEAPVDPDTGKKTVTHSVIAKDSPDNPIWHASSALKDEAVKGIGTVLYGGWNSSISTDAVDAQVDQALAKYICIPSADPWWQAILTKEMP